MPFPHTLRPASRTLGLLFASVLLLFRLPLTAASAPPPTKDEFLPLVQLAPFVVNGQSLAISIYARTKSDRRYGEEFAERVTKVVYESVTESTGRGLVIIGAKGEPHPITVFRKFLALAREGKLDPAIAARAPELAAALDHWEHSVDKDKKDSDETQDRDGEVDMDFEKIVSALPIPLEGVGAKLYQLAWAEKFDEAKVEARLRALRPDDLERRDLFKSFDWVFYLPPKGAFDRVLDELIADALKHEDVSFFARVAVKGVLLAVKPKIRRAIEAMRQGLLFKTEVQAQSGRSEEDVAALTDAYIEVFMPGEKSSGGSDHERAVAAVRARLRQLDEKPKPAAAP
ncbi:MAG: hypothetical protein JSS11_02565 [Verrucomicrobia bacterium]|nr:hypothetical protein [Verrucomicrobiota bacterium]